MKDEDILLPEITDIKWASYAGRNGTNIMKEYAREAVRMNQIEGTTDVRAEAWDELWAVLEILEPKFKGYGGLGCYPSAIEFIQGLIPGSASLGEPRPFSLEAAKRGEPLVTRDGRKISEIHHFETDPTEYPVCAIIEGECIWFKTTGVSDDTVSDLFLAPKPKRTVWVNAYMRGESIWHETKESAIDGATNSYGSYDPFLLAVAVPIQIDDVGGEG